ncbi:hypothetical protein SERLA73DRAFT_75338 [Serpula lacrymans var. lacrymans S7.3]|uniref:Uncharacterized protein n=2 Tax=Serpula lacrymans var. lacrymans TaxID=341189 RepID=F8Q3B7_SERL3|nr:uncharacterized protein SERLADRAFT_440009 [Serpula lacrymans var. lacrymans S7.9]EGN97678.1 hypothetical protein SERLA73DRAFT_75338 [Serpula lacrymans var. lacrymans S7.3]EGO23269.1 hypothetical protein SERLADRAFT_440009 [Serpula lacrymans var. lacrymans S7.9]
MSHERTDRDNENEQDLDQVDDGSSKTFTSCFTDPSEQINTQGKPALPYISWTDSCIHRLIEWLEKHLRCRQMLFSDSRSVAKDEGRPVVKDTKKVKEYIHEWIAKHVFKNDSQEMMHVAVDHHRKKFGVSVQNRLAMHALVRGLLKTGQGIPSEEASQGFDNSFQKIRKDFKWWDWLHAFWETSPKYNAKPVTGSKGQYIDSQAVTLLFPMRADHDAMARGIQQHEQERLVPLLFMGSPLHHQAMDGVDDENCS